MPTCGLERRGAGLVFFAARAQFSFTSEGARLGKNVSSADDESARRLPMERNALEGRERYILFFAGLHLC